MNEERVVLTITKHRVKDGRKIVLATIYDEDDLSQTLSEMNEQGIEPRLPFIDSDGVANMAVGMAPSGDDWEVGFITREPDSGTPHCCLCSECYEIGTSLRKCYAGEDWEPTYPLTAMIVGQPL